MSNIIDENDETEEMMNLSSYLSEIARKNENLNGEIFFHILPGEDWEKAQVDGVYSPVSMESDGFIHCSLSQQVEETLENFFAGQKDLLILCIAGSKVKAEIRFEDLYQAGQEFPHIYGDLNLDAVVDVLQVTNEMEGDFGLQN